MRPGFPGSPVQPGEEQDFPCLIAFHCARCGEVRTLVCPEGDSEDHESWSLSPHGGAYIAGTCARESYRYYLRLGLDPYSAMTHTRGATHATVVIEATAR